MHKIMLIILLCIINALPAFADDDCDLAPADRTTCVGPGGGVPKWNSDRVGRIFSTLGSAEILLKNIKICNCEPSHKIKFFYDGPFGDTEESLQDGENTTIDGYYEMSAEKQGDMLCLYATPGIGSKFVVGCKYFALEEKPAKVIQPKCNIADSCFNQAITKTQSIISLTGVAVQCMGDTLDKVFFQSEACHVEDFGTYSLFKGFRNAMKKIVMVALTIYVMIFGFRVVLGQEATLKKSEIMTFIFKLIFVLYFSIGIQQSDGSYRDGVTDFVNPTFKAISNGFSQYIISAGGVEGLCKYDQDDYEDGYKYLALWDIIDCKVAYYLFLFNPVPQAANQAISLSKTTADLDTDNTAAKVGWTLAILVAFLGLLFTKWFVITILMLLVFIFVTGSMLYFVYHFILCMFSFAFTMFLAPIFVPMVLFNNTKPYFDTWLKVSGSFALQPVVLATLIALMLTIYDDAIYKDCTFSNVDCDYSEFCIKSPSETCKESIGYIVNSFDFDKDLVTQLEDFGAAIFHALKIIVVFSFLFYYFSSMVTSFAADVTGGMTIDYLGAINGTSLIKGSLGKIKGKADSKINSIRSGGDKKDKGKTKRSSGIKGVQS